jgi:hypothetical protein
MPAQSETEGGSLSQRKGPDPSVGFGSTDPSRQRLPANRYCTDDRPKTSDEFQCKPRERGCRGE